MPRVLPYSPFCRIALSELYAFAALFIFCQNQAFKQSYHVTDKVEPNHNREHWKLTKPQTMFKLLCLDTSKDTAKHWTNVRQTFNKLSTILPQTSTNHQQTIHKLSTNSRQTLNKLSTNLRQTIEKLSTNSRQTFHKLSTNSWQTLHKLLTNLQQSLARTFRAFLQTFCKLCKHSFKNTNQ